MLTKNSQVKVFRTDTTIQYLPGHIIEPDLTRLQKEFKTMQKLMCTQNPIINWHETNLIAQMNHSQATNFRLRIKFQMVIGIWMNLRPDMVPSLTILIHLLKLTRKVLNFFILWSSSPSKNHKQVHMVVIVPENKSKD